MPNNTSLDRLQVCLLRASHPVCQLDYRVVCYRTTVDNFPFKRADTHQNTDDVDLLLTKRLEERKIEGMFISNRTIEKLTFATTYGKHT